MNNSFNKIFCIGFPRTGTTTLSDALSTLGYKVRGGPEEIHEAFLNNDIDAIIDFVKKHDAFQDDPWPQLYKKLDKLFPNSKFILTKRDEKKWIRSIVNYFGHKYSPTREKIYGAKYPIGYENTFLSIYKKHNSNVINYFSKRPKDLLIIEWERGDSWKELCSFLNVAIPIQPLPHRNKMNKTPTHKIYRVIKRKLLKLNRHK